LQGGDELLEVSLALAALTQHAALAETLKPPLDRNPVHALWRPGPVRDFNAHFVDQRDQLDQGGALQLGQVIAARPLAGGRVNWPDLASPLDNKRGLRLRFNDYAAVVLRLFGA